MDTVTKHPRVSSKSIYATVRDSSNSAVSCRLDFTVKLLLLFTEINWSAWNMFSRQCICILLTFLGVKLSRIAIVLNNSEQHEDEKME